MALRPGGTQLIFDFETHPVEEKEVTGSESLPWIKVATGTPYFITDNGEPWTPIGQNDAITWPELAGAFRRRDLATVEKYFGLLVSSGVTCIRLMLEYCHSENRYLEKPAGYFQPNMIRLWDDIFALCEKYKLRILLTPYDTFWMWRRWSHHPYNTSNNGPCNKRSQWLLCAVTRAAIKQRLLFVTQRWGSSGALFAWDLWNEIRPAHGGNSTKAFYSFIEDIAGFLRSKETELHGRAHPQTVSVFSPTLQKDLQIADSIFRHPSLDFASIHLYEQHTIDNPKNTIDAALSTGRLIREVLSHIKDHRPFFDSEHGPIKYFKDHGRSLPEFFDDEYFRHMQWAHLASGGAGGGLRWPYRHPHTLTEGMRKSQLAMKRFLPLISWDKFHRINLNNEILTSDRGLKVFACGDNSQVILWLLRINALDKNRMLRKETDAASLMVAVPFLIKGRYLVTVWNTESGSVIHAFESDHNGESTWQLPLPAVKNDAAVALVRLGV